MNNQQASHNSNERCGRYRAARSGEEIPPFSAIGANGGQTMRSAPTIAMVVASFIHGCAMERTVTRVTDNRPCVANYSTEGGFWTGKQFKTYEDFATVEKNAAFDKLVAGVASGGLQVVNSNKDLGIISASTTVSYGKGKTVPLNVVITNIKPSGIRVELVFTLSGGVATSADMVQEKFCNLLAAVSR